MNRPICIATFLCCLFQTSCVIDETLAELPKEEDKPFFEEEYNPYEPKDSIVVTIAHSTDTISTPDFNGKYLQVTQRQDSIHTTTYTARGGSSFTINDLISVDRITISVE